MYSDEAQAVKDYEVLGGYLLKLRAERDAAEARVVSLTEALRNIDDTDLTYGDMRGHANYMKRQARAALADVGEGTPETCTHWPDVQVDCCAVRCCGHALYSSAVVGHTDPTAPTCPTCGKVDRNMLGGLGNPICADPWHTDPTGTQDINPDNFHPYP